MARYMYETSNGKQVPFDDYMFTEMGIEGIQVQPDGKVVLVLVLPDGSVMFDYESGKDADALKSAKEEYQQMASRQKDQFRARAAEIIAFIGQRRRGRPSPPGFGGVRGGRAVQPHLGVT